MANFLGKLFRSMTPRQELTTGLLAGLLLALAAGSSASARTDRAATATRLQAAREAYEHDDFAGIDYAQHEWALMLLNGNGVPADRTEGLRWLKAAADQGFEPAAKDLRRQSGDTAPAAPAAPQAVLNEPPPDAWKVHVLQWMKRSYGAHDARLGCWPTTYGKGRNALRYCMKVVSQHWGAPAADGAPTRLYLLAAGQPIDDQGETLPAHADPSLAGAFVLEYRGGAWQALASAPQLPLGSAASPPDDWQFHEVGQGIFGWIGLYGDCHQGFCERRVALLVPRERRVVDVGFPVLFDASGACSDPRCEARATTLEMRFQTDDTRAGTPLRPLQVELQGRVGGRPVSRRFGVRFDAAKWRYAFPSEPALDALMHPH